MDRHQFLAGAAFFTVAGAGLSACGGGGDASAPAGQYAFAQGVASGDPREGSLVFWTRSNGSVADVPLLKRTRITLASGSHTPLVEDNI